MNKTSALFRLSFLFGIFLTFAFAFSHYTSSQSKSESEEQSAQKENPNPSKVDPTPTPHTLVGSYYLVDENIEAKLLLNNKGDLPLEVQPTLYNLQGQELQLPPVKVEPQNFRFINLADWAKIGGESYRSGNIKLFHYGKDLVLGAQIYLTDEANSVSFEEKLTELGKFDSRRQESVWWMPSNQSDVKVVLTNTTGTPLSITGMLSRKPHHIGTSQTFQLAAHETKLLDLRNDFANGNQFADSEILGLSFEHCAVKDALLARVLIRETNRGYSNFAQFSNPAKGKSKEYQGVGFQIEDIAGERLMPVIAARNVGSETATVNAKITYTLDDGTKGIVTLPQERLRSGEMNLLKTQKIVQLARREQVKVASLIVNYDTLAGSVIVASHTVSNNRNQVFRVPMWDPLAQRSPTGGYPWRIEGTSQTETYIKNITDQEQDYVAFLVWENGGKYMIGLKPIAAQETVRIDVKKLRDEQIPDEQGRTIPLYVSSGQLQWTLHRKDNLPDDDVRASLALIGRSEQVDLTKGIVNNYACQNCCAGDFSFGYVLPGDRETEFGNTIQYEAYEEGETCYGSRYIYRITHPQWSSSNQSVATINSGGAASTQGVGETEIKAKWYTRRYYETEPCPPGPYIREEASSDCGKVKSRQEEVEINNLLPECGSCASFSSQISSTSDLTVKPKIRILRDGTDITSTTQNNNLQTVIVGQRINLSATVAGGSPSTQSWDVPEKKLKNYETLPAGRFANTGRIIPLTAVSSNNVDFVWYEGTYNGMRKQVTYTATVNGISNSAQATFDVKKPNVDLTMTSPPTFLGTANINGAIRWVILLANSTGTVQGATFNRQNPDIPTPFSGGEFQFVQLVSYSLNGSYTSTTSTTPIPINQSESGLDGCYPYGLNDTTVRDSPSLQLDDPNFVFQNVSVSNTWSMFLMYKPTGTGSEWVPLRSIDWAWAYTATRGTGGVYTSSGVTNPASSATGIDTTTYPVWSNRVPDRSGDNCTSFAPVDFQFQVGKE